MRARPSRSDCEREVALVLAELARQEDGREASLHQRRLQVAHGVASVGEDDRRLRLDLPEDVDDRVLHLVGEDADDAVFDVLMAALAGSGFDAQGVALVALGQRRDGGRDGRREQQGAPVLRRRIEDELQILAEAEVEHLVGLVEHHGLRRVGLQRATLDMVTQASRRADDDMGAVLQQPALAAGIHATHAGDNPRPGVGVEPGQLALNL